MVADTGEEIIIPGLETIPVLPEDYPLFDWTDWPDSREALQSGVATNRFRKEAWNAIVDTLANALELAGIGWREPYKIEDSKILRPHGPLKATAFNVVRSHVDLITDFPWPWQADPESRGYIGTEFFKGTRIERDDAGNIVRIREGDPVYPEYILELVRRVNLLLELMRGTADTEELAALHASLSQIQSSGAVSGAGVHMGRPHMAATRFGNIALEKFSGAGFDVRHPAGSLSGAEMEKVPGAGISKWLQFYSNIALSGRAVRDEYVLRPQAQWLAASMAQAAAEYIYPTNTSAAWLIRSLGTVSAAQGPLLAAAGQQIGFTTATITADAMKDLKATSAQQQSATGFQIDVKPIQPRFVVTGHRSRSYQQLAILLTRMVEILMYTELNLLLRGIGTKDRAREILMATGGYTLLMQGQGKEQAPEDLLLHTDPRLKSRAGHISGLFDPRYAFGTDLGIWTAAGGIELPEGSVLWALAGLLRTVRPRADSPTEVSLWALAGILRTVRPRVETPSAHLLWTVRTDVYDAVGKLKNPERLYLHDPGISVVTANFRKDAPEALMLQLGKYPIASARGRDHQITNELLRTLMIQVSETDAALEVPRDLLMKAIAGAGNMAVPAWQAPTRSRMRGLIRTVSRTDSGLEIPDEQLLLSLAGILRTVRPRLQKPSGWVLNGIAGIVSRFDEELTHPWAYLACADGHGISETAPDLEVPDLIRLCTSIGIEAVANVTQLHRRYRRAVAMLLDSGFLSADLTEPATIRMVFESMLMTLAHAGVKSRKVLPTSGYLAELIGGFVTAALLEAEDLAMVTSAELSTAAESDIIRITRATVGSAVLQMEIDADASGFILRIMTARGSIEIEMPVSYAAADTAAAIHSAGKRIDLQITAQMGGRNAKYAGTLLWSAIPAPVILSGGINEAVRAILAAVSVGDVEILGQGDVIGTVRSDGSTAFALTSVGGGFVRRADGAWFDPVQTGSNLHITHAQQSWNDGQKLYIDLDVFYEPVRRDSDLYIRSADYVWTDGSSANIDTEFFLEPVQEGSNLYIRQDIFGGE